MRRLIALLSLLLLAVIFLAACRQKDQPATPDILSSIAEEFSISSVSVPVYQD
ncbi:MAG: hypothetical protein LBB67_00515 [Oscillospiraceae bacterium]|jgi:outer membrane lipoprotein-sorting protein|nr:hypothetical protein [Oscillospiraceae bacterium]